MFVSKANLPMNMVTAMIISPQYDKVMCDFIQMGIRCILTDKCTDVQDPVSFHPDILCHHVGGDKIVVYPYSHNLNYNLELISMNTVWVEKPFNQHYPNDVALNSVRIGDYLICNKKYTDRFVLESVEEDNIIDIPQGYAKCSTLIVDEDSIITADRVIAQKFNEIGKSALLIRQGDVRLDGHDYGFIGGAGVKLSKDIMYLTGQLSSHKDGDIIRDFILERNIKLIEGIYPQLIDVGSMIPLLECDDIE